MTEPVKPRAPRGLGVEGRKLFKGIVDEFDMTHEPHKLEVLTQAARVTDKIAELEKAAEGQPLTVLGSAKQLTIHPLISEARFQRGLLATLLGKLGLPESDEEVQMQQTKRTETAKAAAKVRWSL